MTIVFMVIWTCMLVFGASAVWALVWAIRTKQFSNFNAGAASIFDPEEPVGRATDSFPGGSR